MTELEIMRVMEKILNYDNSYPIILVNDFNFFYQKGIESCDLEMYDVALSNYDKAIELTSNQNDLSDVWTEKGLVMEKIKDYDMAIICQDKAIGYNPNNEDAWYMKGVSFGKMAKSVDDPLHNDAKECYEKVLSLKPNDIQALDNLGVTLYRLKDYEGAIKCFDKSISIEPNQSFPWIEKARVLKELGSDEEAEQCFAKAKELE